MSCVDESSVMHCSSAVLAGRTRTTTCTALRMSDNKPMHLQ